MFYAPSIDYYVVTRYADIERVFLDHETFSAANAQLPLIPLAPEVGTTLLDGGHRPQPSMVSLDPPAHGRLRKPAARAFTPRRVQELEPTIRATAAALLDAVDATRPFDLIDALAFPLPNRRFRSIPTSRFVARRRYGCSNLVVDAGAPAGLAGGNRRLPDDRRAHYVRQHSEQ